VVLDKPEKGYNGGVRGGSYLKLVSAGPDGKFDTADDWKDPKRHPNYQQYYNEPGLVHYSAREWYGIMSYGRGRRAAGFFGDKDKMDALVERPVIRLEEETATAPADMPRGQWNHLQNKNKKSPARMRIGKGGSGSASAAFEKKPVRIREYFPETLLFEPSLITDELGRATLTIPQIADSITTFRMTASAVSKLGALGSASGSIRIFQDFFVDIDLPVALTRGDEVSIPIAVYNYLRVDQDVRITMEKADWFEMLSDGAKTLTLGPGEVTAAYFRIRAKDVGLHKLLFSQVTEGMEAMLRMPGG
jgi:hypothetical protein